MIWFVFAAIVVVFCLSLLVCIGFINSLCRELDKCEAELTNRHIWTFNNVVTTRTHRRVKSRPNDKW